MPKGDKGDKVDVVSYVKAFCREVFTLPQNEPIDICKYDFNQYEWKQIDEPQFEKLGKKQRK